MENRLGPLRNVNANLEGLKPSATVAINERSNLLRAEGRTIYKLGLGQSPFPVPDRLVVALREHAAEKDYLPVRGLASLREGIADFHRQRDGLDRSPSSVIVGPGSKELMFLTRLAYAGDLVIPSPSWVSYEPQARILGKRALWLGTNRRDAWRVTPDSLDAFCQGEGERPRLLILNYPSNPTGASYTQAELESLAEVARRHRILVLSDEIYGEVHHRGEHVSLASLYPEGTILSSGISKWCGAGGWRLGYFSFPDELDWLADVVAVAASETYTSVSAPIQYAAAAAFSHSDELVDYLARSRLILGSLCRWVAEQLAAVGAECGEPVGGFYVFPDFSSRADDLASRDIQSSPALCNAILEELGVGVLPGSCFGRPANELTLRIAFVDFDGAAALKAVDGEVDDAFLRRHCSPVVTAIESLCHWFNNL